MGARQVPRPADRRRARPRHARLPRRAHQHQAAPAGELRPRGAWSSSRRGSATTSRSRRVRRGARVHRVEPAERARRDRQHDPTSYQEFVYNAATARHDGQDVHVPDLPRRLQHHSRARRGGGHAGRHRSSDAAGQPTRRPRAASRASCGTSSSASSIPPDPAFVEGVAGVYLAERHRHARGDALHRCSRTGSQNPGNFIRATRGRRSSSCGR